MKNDRSEEQEEKKNTVAYTSFLTWRPVLLVYSVGYQDRHVYVFARLFSWLSGSTCLCSSFDYVFFSKKNMIIFPFQKKKKCCSCVKLYVEITIVN